MLKLWRALPYSTERQETTVLTAKMKQRIKAALRTERPTLHIGKEGATPQIVNEAAKQLDSREMIKAKILKTALQDEEAKTIAVKIAEETESVLIEVRGHTFLLFKRKAKKR
ncbi:MAG: YhbY family RNA-binding protein [Candidatus Bathyarchaeota archaeon]|nr:YhbY family RNA-binding protein [Candidatus Bathyarchaeum sp.]